MKVTCDQATTASSHITGKEEVIFANPKPLVHAEEKKTEEIWVLGNRRYYDVLLSSVHMRLC